MNLEAWWLELRDVFTLVRRICVEVENLKLVLFNVIILCYIWSLVTLKISFRKYMSTDFLFLINQHIAIS
jgi:hypothetical protein